MFKRYWPYIKEYKFRYSLVLFGILLAVSATTASAHIMKYFTDDVLINKDIEMLYLVSFGLVGIYIIKAIGTYIQSVNTKYIGQHIVTRFREKLLDKIINLDMGFLYFNRSGDLISRVTYDINRLKNFASNMVSDLVRETLSVIALVGYVIWLNPMLAFYALVVVPLVIYPIFLIAKKLKKYARRAQKKNADIVSRLTEVFNNSEIIKANATEKYEVGRFANENWKFFKINLKTIYVGELVSPILEIFGAIGLAVVIFIGGQEVIVKESMTPGELTAFVVAIGMVFQPIRRLGTIYSKIQDVIAATERIFSILDRESTIKDGNKILKEDITKIEFKDVSLKYEGMYALQDINLQINAGDKIALVGDSGGGKSTFINMLLRFYDPDVGSISVNNRDIKEFTQESLKHHISLVAQRVYIFQDTLAANVAYGQELDELRVKEALQLADALEFTQNLKDGIYTKMEEFGSNLSGGQRQRLSIARAIYKHSSILLFDEATSALDNESEKRIQRALNAYTKDKITITIAHRLSTIEHADTILVMQKGRIIASGTHQELLKNSTVYQKLAGELS
ncbi:MAG: ABC transporter permease [Sulfurimonas sp.]|nr:MAG: ABC transporter permease [Sulfurimonas sp.]